MSTPEELKDSAAQAVEAARDACLQAVEAARRANAAIEAALEALPDGPVKRLSDKRFVVSSRNLNASRSLDPFSYDHKAQYRELLRLVRRLLTDEASRSALDGLREVLDKGVLPSRDRDRRLVFAPEVIERARPIIEPLLEAWRTLPKNAPAQAGATTDGETATPGDPEAARIANRLPADFGRGRRKS